MSKRIFLLVISVLLDLSITSAKEIEPIESLVASSIHEARNAQLRTYEIGVRLLIEARDKLLLANLNQLAQLNLPETASYVDNRTWFQRAHPYCFELRWYNYDYDTYVGNTLSLTSKNCEHAQAIPIQLQEHGFSPIDLPWDEKKKASYEAAYLLLFANDIFKGINFPWSIWKYSNGVNIIIKDARTTPPQCYLHVVDPHENSSNPPDHILINISCFSQSDSSYLLILKK